MDLAGSLPVWAQGASMIAIALVATVIGVINYIKTSANKTVPAGTVIDGRSIKDLVDSITDLQDSQERISKKEIKMGQDIKEAINELNEAIIVQTDTTMNLVRFLNRESNKNRMESSI